MKAIASSAVLATALVGIDQVVKAAALTVQYEYRCLAGEYLCFGLAENFKSGFGIVAVDSIWFVVLVPIVLTAVAVWIIRFFDPPWSYYAVALMTAGALSNWLDRLRLGFVVDYYGPHLPTTNLADAYVTAGIVATIYAGIRKRRSDS